jgi:orotate phosphoribosyltransferase-like protein
MFRQYVNQGEIHPCIIVDDIIRSGSAIEETVKLVEELGAKIIGCGTIVRFESAPKMIAGVPVQSLLDFDAKWYNTGEECVDCKENVPEEKVRF